ncbi:MAG: hypothetical protein QOH79_3175, partial [Acidimicrobiaceae bacterium]
CGLRRSSHRSSVHNANANANSVAAAAKARWVDIAPTLWRLGPHHAPVLVNLCTPPYHQYQ